MSLHNLCLTDQRQFAAQQMQPQACDNKTSPVSVVFHHDLTNPIQYDLGVPAVSQSVSWLLCDGRPMSVKTANDPPRDTQSLLALYHVKLC